MKAICHATVANSNYLNEGVNSNCGPRKYHYLNISHVYGQWPQFDLSLKVEINLLQSRFPLSDFLYQFELECTENKMIQIAVGPSLL